MSWEKGFLPSHVFLIRLVLCAFFYIPVDHIRDQGGGHIDHGAALKSRHGENNPDKGNKGDDQPVVQPLPDFRCRNVRGDQPVLPACIQPLQGKDKAEDHEIELKKAGGNDIRIVIADKTGRERDEGYEKKADDIDVQESMVNMVKSAELSMMGHPERGKDKECDDVVVEIRQQGNECSAGTLACYGILGQDHAGDKERHGKRKDPVGQGFQAVLLHQHASCFGGFAHTCCTDPEICRQG
jgi:hypothetical protein